MIAILPDFISRLRHLPILLILHFKQRIITGELICHAFIELSLLPLGIKIYNDGAF